MKNIQFGDSARPNEASLGHGQNGKVQTEKDVKSRPTLPLSQIIADKNQIRKEFPENEINALAESIKNIGLITPIIVMPIKGEIEKYKIVDGERRFRAYCKLEKENPGDENFRSICVSFIDEDNPIKGVLANLARKLYNPMESAEALEAIKNNINLTDEQLGLLVEKSRSSITEYLSLLKLPKEIRDSAKAQSVVPFRSLKRLVSLDVPNEDKIVIYNKLVEKYQPKKGSRKKRENAKSPWNADRQAVAFQKRVDNFVAYFDRLDIGGLTDSERKSNLKQSLQIIIEKANAMITDLDKRL